MYPGGGALGPSLLLLMLLLMEEIEEDEVSVISPVLPRGASATGGA
jgi:hypothetical protein